MNDASASMVCDELWISNSSPRHFHFVNDPELIITSAKKENSKQMKSP